MKKYKNPLFENNLFPKNILFQLGSFIPFYLYPHSTTRNNFYVEKEREKTVQKVTLGDSSNNQIIVAIKSNAFFMSNNFIWKIYETVLDAVCLALEFYMYIISLMFTQGLS